MRWLVWTLGFLTVAAQAGTARGASCGAIDGADAVIGAGTVVLVGEMHGTEQSPSFVSDLVCTALDRAVSVTVALEIPQEEAARVTAYLDSDGGDAARAALLAGPFWTDEYQDGRRSEAELALLDSLRRDRRAGLPVKMALLDRREQTTGTARDAFMASRLADAATASPGDFLVSLTGNVHSSTRKGTPWDAEYRPMALELEGRLSNRRVVALDVAYDGGSAWNCRATDAESCRPYELKGTAVDGSGRRRIVLDESLKEKGYDGYYAVGTLTASPPAFQRVSGVAEGPRR
jgi:erythromycin esterase-like protein